MLAKKHRLPIQSVLKKNGRALRGRYFLFKVFGNNLEYNRFGVIISKKVAKSAVLRNKLKRIILNAFREHIFSGKKKQDFLIIVSPQIADLDPKKIKLEISHHVPNLFN